MLEVYERSSGNDGAYLYDEVSTSYGSIFEYMERWDNFLQENPEIPLLAIHYEDLKQNIVEGIKRIGEFLEIPLAENIVQAISDGVDFKYVKANEHLIYNEQMRMRMFKNMSSSFYRKGIVGDWKNYFTVAQKESFQTRFQERMKKSRFLSRYA
ncbi:hypothetical protein CHS0354_025440 [Potamilus streckersoni]|uniref:Sulfotransferase domain-containing protein n=1 Tax=Potamilus streckersoni TaxID=2493646 RepID=A0AAE0VZE8_9BIVA|nr:hypothetical protein CHS0354_025440 [Potamilus streckersoni]